MNEISQNQNFKQNNEQNEYYTSVGNYLIGKTIGKGTFGKVKLGMHKTTEEKVAVKILEKEKIQDEGDKIRIQREIQILRKIKHPHIIQLYEIIETPKKLFLIMEYAPKGELFEHIVKKTRLREREACQFYMQIIDAIEYLHKIGIVHRDLKPENLLINFDNTIKVVDFGLSNTYNQGQSLSTACGSPCYAAPEMVSGLKYNGLQTDIWSTGIILYAMVCGYLPFENKSTAKLYKQIIQGNYKLPSWVGERTSQFLKGVLNTDPKKRFTINNIRESDFSTYYKNDYKQTQGIEIGKDQIPIDTDIILKMEKIFKFDSKESINMVHNNKHNTITATYYLLLNQHLRSGKKSQADLRQIQQLENFQAQPPLKYIQEVESKKQQEQQNLQEFTDINLQKNANTQDFGLIIQNISSTNPSSNIKISSTGGSNEINENQNNDIIKKQNTQEIKRKISHSVQMKNKQINNQFNKQIIRPNRGISVDVTQQNNQNFKLNSNTQDLNRKNNNTPELQREKIIKPKRNTILDKNIELDNQDIGILQSKKQSQDYSNALNNLRNSMNIVGNNIDQRKISQTPDKKQNQYTQNNQEEYNNNDFNNLNDTSFKKIKNSIPTSNYVMLNQQNLVSNTKNRTNSNFRQKRVISNDITYKIQDKNKVSTTMTNFSYIRQKNPINKIRNKELQNIYQSQQKQDDLITNNQKIYGQSQQQSHNISHTQTRDTSPIGKFYNINHKKYYSQHNSTIRQRNPNSNMKLKQQDLSNTYQNQTALNDSQNRNRRPSKRMYIIQENSQNQKAQNQTQQREIQKNNVHYINQYSNTQGLKENNQLIQKQQNQTIIDDIKDNSNYKFSINKLGNTQAENIQNSNLISLNQSYNGNINPNNILQKPLKLNHLNNSVSINKNNQNENSYTPNTYTNGNNNNNILQNYKISNNKQRQKIEKVYNNSNNISFDGSRLKQLQKLNNLSVDMNKNIDQIYNSNNNNNQLNKRHLRSKTQTNPNSKVQQKLQQITQQRNTNIMQNDNNNSFQHN